MKVQQTDVQTDRIVTIPNIISFIRLLGVPLFLWLILVPQADGWALVLLVASSISDWLDGKIARATGQIKYPLAGPDPGHLDRHALEDSMGAERHQVVHHVVTAGNALEDFADQAGLFGWRNLAVAEVDRVV